MTERKEYYRFFCRRCGKRIVDVYNDFFMDGNGRIFCQSCYKNLPESIKEGKWCACGDEFLIEGNKCETCKFLEEEQKRKKYVCYGCRREFEQLTKYKDGWYCKGCLELIKFNEEVKTKC